MRRLTQDEISEIEKRATRNREGTDEPDADYLPGWRLRCRHVGVDCLILLQEMEAQKQDLYDLCEMLSAEIKSAPDYPHGGSVHDSPIHDALCEVGRHFHNLFRENYPDLLDRAIAERTKAEMLRRERERDGSP